MRATSDQIQEWITGLTSLVPWQFFYAMAGRESNYNPACMTPEDNGTTSIGLWQVNAEEATQAGETGDLKDPEVNARVIVYKMTQNLYALANAYGFNASMPPSDIWYYLAASHNAGLARVKKWIDEQNGVIDWAQTVENHPTFVTIAKGYAQEIGDAVPSGDGSPPDGTDVILVLIIAGAAIVMAVA